MQHSDLRDYIPLTSVKAASLCRVYDFPDHRWKRIKARHMKHQTGVTGDALEFVEVHFVGDPHGEHFDSVSACIRGIRRSQVTVHVGYAIGDDKSNVRCQRAIAGLYREHIFSHKPNASGSIGGGIEPAHGIDGDSQVGLGGIVPKIELQEGRVAILDRPELGRRRPHIDRVDDGLEEFQEDMPVIEADTARGVDHKHDVSKVTRICKKGISL